MTLRLSPGAGVRLRQNDVPGARRSGGDLLVPLGDLVAGRRRRVMVPLVLGRDARGAVLTVQATFAGGGAGAGASDRAVTLAARGVLKRTDEPAHVRAAADREVAEEGLRQSTARVLEAAMALYSSGRQGAALARLHEQIARLERARRSGSRVARSKLKEVREVLRTCRDHAPSTNQGIATARVNRAKSYEIRRGLGAGDLFHVDPFDAAELE